MDGVFVPVLGAGVRTACPCDYVGMGTEAISFCVLSLWIVWIACPPSCDCRAIPRLIVRVVMWSGLGRVRLLPRLFRIPCGFVFFPRFPSPLSRVLSRPRSPACLVLIALRHRPLSVGVAISALSYRPSLPACRVG